MADAYGHDRARHHAQAAAVGHLYVTADGAAVRVRGEVDLATAPYLAASLLDAIRPDTDCLVVDFADVTFMDACGLSALLEVQAHLRRDGGGRVSVRSPSIQICQLFEITGLTEFLTIPS